MLIVEAAAVTALETQVLYLQDTHSIMARFPHTSPCQPGSGCWPGGTPSKGEWVILISMASVALRFSAESDARRWSISGTQLFSLFFLTILQG